MKIAKPLQLVAPAVLTLVTVLVVGYLGVQIEGTTKGYLVGMEGAPTIAIAKRFPWELQIAVVLVGLAAVAAYRKIVVTRASRVTVLAVLAITLIYAGVTFEPMLPSLLVLCLYYGGSSSFTLAMIAGVSADLMFSAGREVPEVTIGDRVDEVTNSDR